MILALQSKIKNGPLVKFREERNLSQAQAAEMCGVNVGCWNALENLRYSHVGIESSAKIAQLIEAPLSEIHPEECSGLDLRWKRRVYAAADPSRLIESMPIERNLLTYQHAGDAEAEIQKSVDAKDLKNQIEAVLKSLTYREREIIKLRYGIGENNGRLFTYEEIGQLFKVTRERVRQVEHRALRKLQHPVRACRLVEFVDKNDTEVDNEPQSLRR